MSKYCEPYFDYEADPETGEVEQGIACPQCGDPSDYCQDHNHWYCPDCDEPLEIVERNGVDVWECEKCDAEGNNGDDDDNNNADDDFDEEQIPPPIYLECEECFTETLHKTAWCPDGTQGFTCSACWSLDVPCVIMNDDGKILFNSIFEDSSLVSAVVS